MRKVALVALMLLVAVPSFADRRRAITPGSPSRCALPGEPLLTFTYPLAMASDATTIYVIDEFDNTIYAVPNTGGAPRAVAQLGFDDFPLTMTADDTSLYIASIPYEGLSTPMPGVIYKVAKTGGAPQTFVSGVNLPFDIEVDATYVYWVSAGTADFTNEVILPDGKIERASKSTGTRETIVANRSTPLDLALDGNDLYFGQSGEAEGDPTIGLFRVAKSGGAVSPVRTDLIVGGVAISGDTIVLYGASQTVPSGVFSIAKNGTNLRNLFGDEALIAWSKPRLIDNTAYFLGATEDADLLVRLPLSTAIPVFLATGSFATSELEVDACGVTYSTNDGDIVRMAR